MRRPAAVAAGVPVVLAPLGVEARAVRAGLRPGTSPAVRIVRLGMGARRAARTAARVHRELAPGMAVAVAGFAGGLRPGLAAGDVVVASELRDRTDQADPEDGADGADRPDPPDGVAADDETTPVLVATADAASVGELVAGLRRLGLRAIAGPVVTSRRMVLSPRHRAELSRTGALAVDLESAAAVRALPDRPVAVLRVITDTAGAGLLRPGLIRRGLIARRVLAAAAPALADWATRSSTASTPALSPEEPAGAETNPRGVAAPDG